MVVEVTPPATTSVTEELRTHDRLAHELPRHAVAAVELFDPECAGIWHTSAFVTDDEPILGRPVTGGRPASFLALEDKMLADAIWAAADVPSAPFRIVPIDQDALAEATAQVAGPLGAPARSPPAGPATPAAASTAAATSCAGSGTSTTAPQRSPSSRRAATGCG